MRPTSAYIWNRSNDIYPELPHLYTKPQDRILDKDQVNKHKKDRSYSITLQLLLHYIRRVASTISSQRHNRNTRQR